MSSASEFDPVLAILPPPQLALWGELDVTPGHFTLYGGTALALRLGHRSSVDFDFFSNDPFDPDDLARRLAYLQGAERIRIAPNTLTCRVQRAGPVLVSFFGDLALKRVASRERPRGRDLHVASALDVAATKIGVVQKRAEAKDYLDLDALIHHGVGLPIMLAAARAIYGSALNPMISLKALSYFEDVPTLPIDVRQRLSVAVKAVDLNRLPVLPPIDDPPDGSEQAP